MFSALHRILRRLRWALSRDQFEGSLDDEIQFHVDSKARDLEARGMPVEEARARAQRQFGNRTLVRESSRGVWLWRPLEELFQDLRLGTRLLWRNPAASLAVVAVLALGAGLNLAVFDVVYAVLMRPLPHPEPHRLVAISGRNIAKGTRHLTSPADFFDLESRSKSLARVAALYPPGFTLTGGEQAERVAGARASSGIFDVFGVQPFLGRGFLAEEDRPGAPRVAVLSHALWKRRYHSDPAILGRTILLSGNPFTVIGVLPADFQTPVFWPRMPEIWTPIGLDRNVQSRQARFLQVFGKLHRDTSVDAAKLEIDTLAKGLAAEHPNTNSNVGASVASLAENLTREVRAPLLILAGAVGLVLLVACANAAGLLLARTSERRHEFAVRLSIGAGRFRLIRQIVVENLLLGTLAVALGLFLAWVSGDLLAAAAEVAGAPRAAEVAIGWETLLAAAGLSLACTLLASLGPALRATQQRGSLPFAVGARGATPAREAHRFRAVLLAAEGALSLALLAGAGLLLRSFLELQSVNPGIDTRNVITTRLSLPSASYPAGPVMAAFHRRLLERLAALPGVDSVAVVDWLPLSGLGAGIDFRIDGQPPAGRGAEPSADLRVVSRDYFRTLRIPLLAGRSFQQTDHEQSPPVVVINRALARRHFGDDDPVGRRILLSAREPVMCEIAGVVGDVRQYNLREAAVPEIFAPNTQQPWLMHETRDLVVRAANDPMAIAQAVRAAVHELERDIPIGAVQPMEEVAASSLLRPKFYAYAVVVFAAAALLLAAFGIYAGVASAVVQRRREIGIRAAFGARREDVVRLMAWRGAAPALAGLAAGIPLALLVGRLLERQLYGVSPSDLPTLFSVAAILAAVALAASLVPARRAARIDPASAILED